MASVAGQARRGGPVDGLAADRAGAGAVVAARGCSTRPTRRGSGNSGGGGINDNDAVAPAQIGQARQSCDAGTSFEAGAGSDPEWHIATGAMSTMARAGDKPTSACNSSTKAVTSVRVGRVTVRPTLATPNQSAK